MKIEEKKEIIAALKGLGFNAYDNPFGDNIQSCLWDESNQFDGFMKFYKLVSCENEDCIESHGSEDHLVRVNLTPIEVTEKVSAYLIERASNEAKESERAKQIASLLKGLAGK